MADSEVSASLWSRLRSRSEFPLLVTGAVLVTLLLAELLVAWLWDPALGRAMVAGMTAEILAGREGGIPVAISGGVPPLLVWQVSVTQDVAFWCLLYPWFLIVYHERHGSGGFAMRRLERIERSARRHQAFASKWGPFGIFLFMLMPFLVNGPMVGGILGRLVGIRTRYLVAPIIASTAIASAAWTFFFDATVARLNAIDPRFGYMVAGVLFVGLFGSGLVGLWLDERRHRLNSVPAHDEEE